MLLIKTEVKPSKINGLGLFAKVDIPKGTDIWKFSGIDIKIRIDEVEAKSTDGEMITINYEYFFKYAYREGNYYIFCSDDAKYMNHSKESNCSESGGYTVTNRDIKAGEELTCDYSKFDEDFNENEFYS